MIINLRAKILGLAILLISGTGIIGGFAYLAIGVFNECEDMRMMRIFLLEARRHEKNFFERKEMRYVQKVESAVADFDSVLRHYLDDPSGKKLPAAIDVYLAAFRSAAEMFQQRGLDENSGAEGRLRKSIHAVEEIVMKTNHLKLRVDLLTIRQNEKDFFLREQPKDVKSLQDGVLRLARHVDESSLPQSVRAEIKTRLDDYEKTFEEMVRIAHQQKQFMETVISAARSLEPVLAEMVDRHLAEAARYQDYAWISFAAYIAISLGLSLQLSAAIVKPLRIAVGRAEELRTKAITNLERAFEAMARGELNQHVDAGIAPLKMTTRDEIGVLAGSLNGIIQQTQTMIASYEKAVSALRAMLGETRDLINASQEGRLEARGKAVAFEGVYRELVEGINATLDAVLLPINEASMTLEKISAHDLTSRMQGDYRGDFSRIKNAMNRATENLSNALNQILVGAQEVSTVAGEISDGSQSLAQATSEQASTIEEISSNLHEMVAMSKQNSTHAAEAQLLAADASFATDAGVNSMERLSQAIDKIKSSSNETSKIVKTIDEIAFQTNLLALNAAVEAARAGDAGKGFAVVAEEVRNLAMRSAEAAKNTASMIASSVKSAEEGVGLNKEVMDKLQEIGRHVKNVSAVVGEITLASDQQDIGVNEINAAILELNKATQQTAANAEESASASEELFAQAENMKSTVSKFILTESSLSETNDRTAGARRRTRDTPARVVATDETEAPRRRKQLEDAGPTAW